jgi:hypothetical protein
MHFLRHLPETMNEKQLNELDAAFAFTASGNSEILFAWLMQCVQNDHQQAYETLDSFLVGIGRRKFLQPLYEELVKTDEGMNMAQRIYKEARPGYHSVSVRTIDEILDWQGTETVF